MSLSTRATGPPAAPAIVFLHGVATSGWMWEGQIDRFPDYHCLIPDLPGHGGSNREPWVSLAHTAAAVADLIRTRAAGGRAHVVGLSLGGYVALQLLAAAPEVVDRAVVSGVSVLPFPNPLRMRLMGYALAPFLTTEAMLRMNARALRIPDALYPGYRAAARATSRRAYLRIGAELLGFRLPAGAGRAGRPTLVVAGEGEHALIQASQAAILAALPEAAGRRAPGAGHGWVGESPELFAATVRAWLAGRPLPPELLEAAPA